MKWLQESFSLFLLCSLFPLGFLCVYLCLCVCLLCVAHVLVCVCLFVLVCVCTICARYRAKKCYSIAYSNAICLC